jgi:hypothetical protein
MMLAMIILALISLIECAMKRSYLLNLKNDSNYDPDKPEVDLPKFHFTHAQRVEQFLKTIQAFQAFNLKQKYEIGKMVAMIIHSNKLEKNGGASLKKAKINNEEVAEVEPDLIDNNPEESWRIAETYINAYKNKPKDDGEDQQSGWSVIKAPLRNEPVFVRSKVLIRAIADEEVTLIKRMIEGKYSTVNIEKYHYAVRNYKEKGTVKCEEIIDYIEKNNPELGAAISRNDKLSLEWDQLKVHDYIYDNNYPMLRRALDDGFDHNFVLPNRGSLLGLSVVAGCYRCVKMLVERGADVNTPLLMDEVIKVKGWNDITSIKGWTPLMIAVADGNVRIVQELIESGSALVSKTGNGQEGPRFHAREVARRIEKKALRETIFGNLRLNSTEKRNLEEEITGKSLENCLKEGNLSLIDKFFLLRNDLNIIPENIQVFKEDCDEDAADILDMEMLKLKSNSP